MKNTLAFLLLMFLPFLAESSELYEPIKTFQADRSALSRKYSNALSEEYFERFGRLYEDWLTTVQDMDYGALSEDGKIDYLAFKNYLEKAVFFHDKALDRKSVV